MNSEEKTIDLPSLFDGEFDFLVKEKYTQTKLRTDLEMLKFFKQFIHLEEEDMTPYKRKLGYYKKKAHYINGKKVNRYIYKYVKDWMDNN